MRLDFVRLRIRAAFRVSMVALVVVLIGTTSLWALPANGSQAPSLNALSLLQAPPGARASWASLKGKVVVLEFWATWCSPCIAGLPHFNQLVASLDPAKFQFISIDDEDTKAVQTFLTKKKMSGWVGIDATGSVYKSYGIKSRPTGVIIDQLRVDMIRAAEDIQTRPTGDAINLRAYAAAAALAAIII